MKTPRLSATQSSDGTSVPKPRGRKASRVQEVWTPKLAEHRFTQVSNFFLDHYNELGLNRTEALLIIHLIRYRWTSDHPFPKYSTLANLMGLHHRRVRAIVSSLEERDFLKRIERRKAHDRSDSNKYDLTPLFARLESLMVEEPKKK